MKRQLVLNDLLKSNFLSISVSNFCVLFFITLTRCHMYDRSCEIKDLFVRFLLSHVILLKYQNILVFEVKETEK